ncbi:MAG: hypothetical protein FJX02_03680 [Alphaproteobacteria bacterium]|nr:hypothetical protein [Alphaproteobacteria bacterium]
MAPRKPRRRILWATFAILLLGATAVGTELVARLFTPPWPAYALRPAPVSLDSVARWHSGMPEIPYVINSWTMRDRERSFNRPADVGFRTAFIGDSFLEGGFTRAPLTARVEGYLVEAGHGDVEAINLGVSGTGPVEYYYRTREVALRLEPDLVVLVFYSGNDVVGQRFPPPASRPWVAELPQPSVLGDIAPHATWHIVNALRLSGAARGGRYAPNERELIADALSKPAAEGLPLIGKMMHRYYFPEVDEAKIHAILARGGERFWSAFRPRRFDREVLQGWILFGLLSWELDEARRALTPEEADAQVSRANIDVTLTWLKGIDALVRGRGKRLLIAVAPVGTVDPEFEGLWSPWGRYYAFTQARGADHRAMVAALGQSGLRFVDLEPDLRGKPGTYRKTDMHWTEVGHEVVAERLAREIAALRPAK